MKEINRKGDERMKKYYALTENGDGSVDLYVFGDITSWEWFKSDVSSYTLAMELQGVEASIIRVHINSYGGEVAEGLAIYNTLRKHSAKVTTSCEGFACSAASLVFMAGDERVIDNASLLMIHNPWTYAAGNAEDFRKQAEDLDKIGEAAANAYRDAGLSLSEEELKAMLDAETWITPDEALEWGFATSISKQAASDKAAASARKLVLASMLETRKRAVADDGNPGGDTGGNDSGDGDTADGGAADNSDDENSGADGSGEPGEDDGNGNPQDEAERLERQKQKAISKTIAYIGALAGATKTGGI